MISRSGSQSTNRNRPYSVNNPFRNASVDSAVGQYSNDRQFQEWVKENGAVPMGISGRNSSMSSLQNSAEGEYSDNSPRVHSPLGHEFKYV